MFRNVTLAVGTTLVLLGCGPREDAQLAARLLASGDAAAGRTAFLDLRCATCHVVSGESGLPEPSGAVQEPFPLERSLASRSPAELADAIVFPSHAVAPGGGSAGTLSRMGDFSDSMTVRQLVDLIAYFRSRAE